MDYSQIAETKTKARDAIKNAHNLPRRPKILIGVTLGKEGLSEEIIAGLAILPVNFVVFSQAKIQLWDVKNIALEDSLEAIDSYGIDAILCSCKNVKLEELMKKWVVPIVNEKNYLWKILSEFSPARGEGNSYLYEEGNLWSAYYALVRYLENLKFPYDNRNLVKNVLWV
jgi:hypothetical protein